MHKKELLHNGAAIKIYQAEQEDKIIIQFTNEITAFYKTKRAEISNKGQSCCSISSMIFQHLNNNGIKTHFIEQLSDNEMYCYKTKSIPLEIIVRNIIAGSLSERLDLEVGKVPAQPIFDVCYKSDRLCDPLINDYHVLALDIVSKEGLEQIYKLSDKINRILTPLFDKVGIILVDYKLEFAYLPNGEIVVRDYINPDNARFWDKQTKASLDKDRFRQDKGNVSKAYITVYERLKTIID